MKTVISIITIASLLVSPLTFAESGASEHSGLASKHSALAVPHATAGSAQVASVAVAVPVFSAGAVALGTGSIITAAGERMVDSAVDLSTPLPVTEKVLTIDVAPNQALDADRVQAKHSETKITKTTTSKTTTVEKTIRQP